MTPCGVIGWERVNGLSVCVIHVHMIEGIHIVHVCLCMCGTDWKVDAVLTALQLPVNDVVVFVCGDEEKLPERLPILRLVLQ